MKATTQKTITRTLAPFELPARIVLSQSATTVAQRERALALIREYIEAHGLLTNASGADTNVIHQIAQTLRPKQVASASAALAATDALLNAQGAGKKYGGSDDATELVVAHSDAAFIFGLTLGVAMTSIGGAR